MTDLFGPCPHCGQPMPDQTQSDFAAFWADCPHKVGKQNTQKAWAKLSAADRHIAHQRVRAFYDWFAKAYPAASPLHPERYLKHHRWTDINRTDATPEDKRASLERMLHSPVDSVREYAKRQLMELSEK